MPSDDPRPPAALAPSERADLPAALALDASADPGVERALRLARLLDARFVDPLLGLLLPGVGDFVTAGLGLYLVAIAVRRRLPAGVVARMLLNLALDALVGTIPALGDLFDFAFRANLKNAELLRTRQPGSSSRGDWLVVAGAALLFLAALAVPAALLVWGFGRLTGR